MAISPGCADDIVSMLMVLHHKCASVIDDIFLITLFHGILNTKYIFFVISIIY